MSRQVKVKGAGRGPSSEESNVAVRWWDARYAGPKARADACMRWLQRVMSRHELRRRVALFNAHMYEDIEVMGLGPYQYAVYDLGSSRLRANVVRACTDTYVSTITQSKPKARILTSDGSWEQKRRAQGLTRWCEGKADEESLYELVSTPCCRDSAVFGLGVAKVYQRYRSQRKLVEPAVKRVFPWELVADDAECQQTNRMRNLAHIEYVDRSELAETYPEQRDYILRHAPKTGPVVQSFDLAINTTSDLVAVSELWHKPAYPGCGDGLHVVCLEGQTLLEEEWDRMEFPFARLYRSVPTMGIFGVSIPHELRGRQTFINALLADTEECLHLYGHPRVLAPTGSIDKSQWDDDLDSIVEYNGSQPPTLYTPNVMPIEVYQAVKDQWAGAFQQLGINAQSAQGQLPEGISGSGASIRAWDDVQSGRMYEASSGFETWHLTIFGLLIEEARAVAKIRGDYSSALRGKTMVSIVRFRDVDPGRDKYWIKTYAESRLSKAPAQRLAQLQELWNGKIITDPAEFRELLEFPDLEGDDALMTSGRELAEKLIDRFLGAEDPGAPGVFVAPEPDWPIEVASGMMQRFQFAKLRAIVDDAPEANVALLDEFISLCQAIVTRATQPPPAPPGAGPARPGAPGAPPTPLQQPPPGPLNVPAAPPASIAA